MRLINYSKLIIIKFILNIIKHFIIDFMIFLISDIICTIILVILLCLGGSTWDQGLLLLLIKIFEVITNTGWYNSLFLLFLYITTISKGCFINKWLVVIESVLFYGIVYIMNEVMMLIPHNIRYGYSYDEHFVSYGLKDWADIYAIYGYTYIILLLLIILIRIIFKNNKTIMLYINGKQKTDVNN